MMVLTPETGGVKKMLCYIYINLPLRIIRLMYVELVLILVQFNSKCLDTSRPAVKMMSSKMD